MLELVDDPVAVTFIIKEAAAMLRRIEGSGAVSPFAVSLPSNWRRRQERDGTGMSHASRAIAEALWLNPTTEKYVRRVAFELWAATNTETDLALLRQPGLPADLEVEILHERLKRRDRSATRALFLRINDAEKNAYMWWSMVRYIWSDDLLPALDAELARRAQAIEPKWQRGSDSDYVTSDLIMRLAPADAEKLLTKYWLSLRYVSYFVQAALYTGTPLTQELVRKAIIECPDPKILLTCIGQHIGIKTMDHPGITRQAQVVAFAPYLGHFAKHEVMDLWQLCNIHGWFEERKKFLDPYLRTQGGILYVDDAPTLASLDDMVAQDRTIEPLGKLLRVFPPSSCSIAAPDQGSFLTAIDVTAPLRIPIARLPQRVSRQATFE